MKKIIIFLLFLLLLTGAYFLLMPSKNTSNNNKPESKPQKLEKPISKTKTKDSLIDKPVVIDKQEKATKVKIIKSKQKKTPLHFTWKDIDIKPMPTPEGVHYVFSGFDIIDKQALAIVGRYSDGNLLKIIESKHLSKIKLPSIPLDVLVVGKKIYVLTQKFLCVVENKKISKKIPINNPQIMFYDKLLLFDGNFNILMSDGSSYQLQNDHLIKHKALLSKKNQEIWIEKSGRNAFLLKANPCDKICQTASFPSEIGSITLAGGTSDNIYICIDQFSGGKPVHINRIISNSQQNFQKKLLTLPSDTFTYVKNDYKIKNNRIYYLKIDENGFKIIHDNE